MESKKKKEKKKKKERRMPNMTTSKSSDDPKTKERHKQKNPLPCNLFTDTRHVVKRAHESEAQKRRGMLDEDVIIEQKQNHSLENLLAFHKDRSEISVYPTGMEVLDNRTFITKRHCETFEDYLDLQYKLLREKYVNYCREAINNIHSKSIKINPRFSHCKMRFGEVFTKVEFAHEEAISSKVCYRVNIKGDFPEELVFDYGSLVCFLTENKSDGVSFGRVVVHDGTELAVEFEKRPVSFKNCIMVRLWNNLVFFEDYFHTLKALKKKAIDVDWSLSSYFVYRDQDHNWNHVPFYLRQQKGNTEYGFGNSLHCDLNLSQSKAFRAALTSEFCIINGIPKSGKTFLALKIVKAILEKRRSWPKDSQMLIVCRSNRALDEILEGLVPVTEDVIRVGSRTTNQDLERFNLNRLRTTTEEKMKLRKLQSEIDDIEQKIRDSRLSNSILDFRLFKDAVPEFANSWFGKASKSEILQWLFGSDIRFIPKENCNFLITAKELIDEVHMESTTDEPGRQTELKRCHDLLLSKLKKQQQKSISLDGNPQKMPPKNKWFLYFHWLNVYQANLLVQWQQLLKNFRHQYKLFEKEKIAKDVEIMEKKAVLGMTFTGATRITQTLKKLTCPVVIMEEVDRVTEAHVVACLTKHCQHLILFGDFCRKDQRDFEEQVLKPFNKVYIHGIKWP